MAILKVNEKIADFSYDTPFAKGIKLSDAVKRVEGKTALVFLRYYGCTLCQYDIHTFMTHYELIKEKKGQLLVVLQSDPVKLAEQIKPDSLPFDIVCDPEQKLYKEFDIKAAASQEAMIGPDTMAAIAKVKESGFQHGEYEGNEFQLPAVFVMDKDLELSYVHYGKYVDDKPGIEEIAKLL